MRLTACVTIALMPLLSACSTSDRIGASGNPFGNSDRVASAPRAQPPRIETAPSARVESSPLAPPPGVSQSEQTIATDPGAAPELVPPTIGGATAGMPPGQATQQQAKVETPRAAEPDNTAPTRSSVIGNWSAKEAAGSCRVTLSSSPKLDLYGASSAGCQSRELQRVTAWELRGDDVYLYEPGGAVAARLKARGRSMDGSIAKSGAPITLSK